VGGWVCVCVCVGVGVWVGVGVGVLWVVGRLSKGWGGLLEKPRSRHRILPTAWRHFLWGDLDLLLFSLAAQPVLLSLA
jgi:hypothetical protein